MTFFSDADIADLQAVQDSALADTCTISDARHKTGAPGQEWIARSSAVACGVSSLSQALQTGTVAVMPDLPGNEPVWIVALPMSVLPLIQGSRIGWDGRTLEVRTVERPGTYGLQVQVVAVER